MIARRTPLRRYTRPKAKRARRRRGPQRSPEYLAWIRTLCCAVCQRTVAIEAAHTCVLGVRGIGQKASDYSAIPLCCWHHRLDFDSYHRLGERRFGELHSLDLQKLVIGLNELY